MEMKLSRRTFIGETAAVAMVSTLPSANALSLAEDISALSALADLPRDPLYVALHTNAPGSGEEYARVAIQRSVSNWIIKDTSVANAQEIRFPTLEEGTRRIDSFSIIEGSSGLSLFEGYLNDPLMLTPGVTPIFAVGAMEIELGVWYDDDDDDDY
jgi:hypothetical protein